ncbi:MAG TPA: hypothetical protein VKX16_03850 [Chloroflexota bacterium]|nr:hypothetical protein [Chloroflexota bacterium]
MIHPLLETLFRRFDDAGVAWCLLRIPTNPVAPAGDVDLLLDPDGAGRARAALDELGFVRLPARGYGSDSFYLGYHAATDHWIWLHIAVQLSFGRYQAVRLDAEEFLARRTRGAVGTGLVAALSPDDAFWALLLHCLLDKGSVPERHRGRLRELAGSAESRSTLARLTEAGCPSGWDAARIVAAARSGDWSALDRLARPLQRRMRRRRVWEAVVRVERFLTRVADLRRRGLLVALMGPDGAGKSTLSAGIQESFFFPSRPVYMGVGTGNLARLARRLSVLGRPPFSYIAYNLTLWARYLTGQYHRWRGRLVIFDRYTYDALLPMPQRISSLKARALAVQARACPAPDLLLVLDVPGEVMYRRKGEFTPEHLERQRQALLALRRSFRNVEILDGTQPQEAVRADAVERIWRRYRSRFASS